MEFKNFFYYFCCCMSEKPVEQTEYVTYNDIYKHGYENGI